MSWPENCCHFLKLDLVCVLPTTYNYVPVTVNSNGIMPKKI